MGAFQRLPEQLPGEYLSAKHCWLQKLTSVQEMSKHVCDRRFEQRFYNGLLLPHVMVSD